MRVYSIKALEKDTAKSTASKHKAPCRRSSFELKHRLTRGHCRVQARVGGRSPFELKYRLTRR